MSQGALPTTTPEELLVISIFAIICGIMFFIIDFYSENKLKEINSSLIAGITVAYFFVLVMPEIANNIPEYPLHLQSFEFLYILVGFTFIHVSEKYILQRVDNKAQDKIRQLLKMEKHLDKVEVQVGQLISDELSHEEIDALALKDMARIISELLEQDQMYKEQEYDLKRRIQNHINEDLDEIHHFTNFVYHFLVGLILLNLLILDWLTGVFFFCFAFFRALIVKSSNNIVLFEGIPIKEHRAESKYFKISFASATLLGVVVAIIFELTFPLSLEIIIIFFSFISGIILYFVVREVIPEKEKGKPLYFLIGVIAFSIVVIVIKGLGYSLLTG
jgi:zinc transporter ZupT